MSHEKNIGLIEMLNRCAIECSHCAMACLNEDHVKMLNRCIKLDLDCAELCRTIASLLSRGSEHGEHLLKECVELCNVCADECEKHSHMQHCKRCAEVCRECAEECSAMA
ncbi:MAG: four-helix bundle copper-binding protein [Bacteroidetes bacterium]|nr:MAG: four-helix bundle copper-binding protein [Bacteroidota bacterium]